LHNWVFDEIMVFLKVIAPLLVRKRFESAASSLLACIIFCDESQVYVLEPLEEISPLSPNYLLWLNLYYLCFACFLSTLKKPQLSFFDYLLDCVIRESASVE
jgi:hypothetical protein